MVSKKLENYVALLAVRQAARQRDIAIIGGIFIVSLMSMVALGMLDQLSGRALYLVAAIVIVFGFAYISTWVRLEIIKGSMELIDNLLLMRDEQGTD